MIDCVNCGSAGHSAGYNCECACHNAPPTQEQLLADLGRAVPGAEWLDAKLREQFSSVMTVPSRCDCGVPPWGGEHLSTCATLAKARALDEAGQ